MAEDAENPIAANTGKSDANHTKVEIGQSGREVRDISILPPTDRIQQARNEAVSLASERVPELVVNRTNGTTALITDTDRTAKDTVSDKVRQLYDSWRYPSSLSAAKRAGAMMTTSVGLTVTCPFLSVIAERLLMGELVQGLLSYGPVGVALTCFTLTILEVWLISKNLVKDRRLSVLKTTCEHDQAIGGTLINEGDLIGELHLNVPNKAELRKLSPQQRGAVYAVDALNDLLTLSESLANNDPRYDGVVAFKGQSDLVTSSLSKVGFTEVQSHRKRMVIETISVRAKRLSSLGLVEGLRQPIGESREVWITREGLIANKENIERLRDRIDVIKQRFSGAAKS